MKSKTRVLCHNQKKKKTKKKGRWAQIQAPLRIRDRFLEPFANMKHNTAREMPSPTSSQRILSQTPITVLYYSHQSINPNWQYPQTPLPQICHAPSLAVCGASAKNLVCIPSSSPPPKRQILSRSRHSANLRRSTQIYAWLVGVIIQQTEDFSNRYEGKTDV